MNQWGWGALALVAVATLLVTSGTQREKPVLGVPDSLSALRVLEARAAAAPDDPASTRGLVQAYLDARQPGLAVNLVESAPPAVRADTLVRHAYARALMDEGRNDDSLAVEQGVVEVCRASHQASPPSPPSTDPAYIVHQACDAVLLASAERRTAILAELVTLGVEDAVSQPDMSFVAYKNATREARIAAE